MIINHFYARKVHGVYDFNLKFEPNLNFLVGNNGTGKTTALRLMQAALSLDILTLIEINFSALKVEVEKDGEIFGLSISSYPDKLAFKINGFEFEYANTAILSLKDGRFDTSTNNVRITHLGDDIRNQVIDSGGPTLKKFIKGRRPMFLGLERRLARYYDEYSIEASFVRDREFKGRVATQKKDSLDGLENCQRLVEEAFRQYRRASDGRLDRLLNIVVESTFEYMELDEEALNDTRNIPYLQMSELEQRREELEKFASDLGGSERTSIQLEKFFEKMTRIVGPSKERSDAWSLEWLINMAQIRRIQKVLAEMDRQKKSAERFYAPIKEFCDTINEFFRHSRKELSVDSVGKIKITQQGNPVDLNYLSSGEKQLLILLAHARFGSTKKSAFIVDEPEVSLHMRWQEMLVDSLLKEGKTNQFIFATHSPEIVGYHTNNCIRLG